MGSSGLRTDPVSESELVDSGNRPSQASGHGYSACGIMNVTLRRRLKTNIFNFKISSFKCVIFFSSCVCNHTS